MQLRNHIIKAAGAVWILISRFGLVRMIDFGPSILQTHGDDEDIFVGSGHDFGSGSGYLDLERFIESGSDDDEEEEIPVTRSPVIKLVTPESSRISCVVCSSKSDPSCRNPYKRNESHIQPCQSSVGGCLEVLTPSGDTYRNCLYGMFATAENKDGCHEIKEEKDVGHKFVNTSSVTICICRTNECNGYNNPHHKVPTPPPSAARGFSSSNHFSKPFSADPAPLLRSRSGSLDRKAPVPIIEAISPPSTTAPTDRLGPKSFLPVSGGFSSTRAPTTSGPKSFLSASVSTGATSTLSTAAPSEGPGAKPSAPSALSRGTNIPGSFPFISMTIAFFGINVLL